MVREVVRSLVDSPDRVKIREVAGTQATVIEVKVAGDDFGKVLGRKGRTANAIRDLMTALSGKWNRRFIFELIE